MKKLFVFLFNISIFAASPTLSEASELRCWASDFEAGTARTQFEYIRVAKAERTANWDIGEVTAQTSTEASLLYLEAEDIIARYGNVVIALQKTHSNVVSIGAYRVRETLEGDIFLQKFNEIEFDAFFQSQNEGLKIKVSKIFIYEDVPFPTNPEAIIKFGCRYKP